MSEETQIIETTQHDFRGEFPVVPTYETVDTALLLRGDDDPFHVTLPIAQSGRISENGLEYTPELVGVIAEQLAQGKGGIRGHIPADQEGSADPVYEVYWIGHMVENDKLWAKGYVPPGATREHIRRLKAIGGHLGTSIYGKAQKRPTGQNLKGKPIWRADNFVLEQVDFASGQRAALKMGQGFAVTKETIEPEQEAVVEIVKEITIADVPVAVREQIVAEAKVKADAARVTELETKVAELEPLAARVAELEKAAEEARGVVTRLAETLKVEAGAVETRVAELTTQIAAADRAAFVRELEKAVEEATPWQVIGDENRLKLVAFRNTVREMVAARLNGDAQKIAETVTGILDGEMKLLAETLRDALAGPSAVIPGKALPRQNNRPDAQTIESARALTGI